MVKRILNEIKAEIKTKKKVRVGINGFGRIGRMIFRAGLEDPEIEFVVINDLSPAETLKYFLKYDSSQKTLNQEIEIKKDQLIVGNQKVKLIQEKDINKLPWEKYNVDVLCECTGIFTDEKYCKIHLENGAKKVLISAPGKGDDVFYLVRGVNDTDYKGENIVSNGSCTTNSMAAVVNEIHKKYGIKKGMFATVHSVTGDQKILDATHTKLRRGRAGPFNIIPTTTGAAAAVVKLIPELKGKLHGIAYRVPTPTGSITDINLELKTKITKEELNKFLKKICKNKLNKIIEYTTEPLVSSDIIGNTHSGIIDSLSTEVVDKTMAKIVIWYDNEFGFSNRMIEVMKIINK
jgi:glyceraldehyde 3-phosphate dehydrogenase